MPSDKFLWRLPSVLIAWRNIGRTPIRTGLAVLGIVIGVVAIASLGIAGAALEQQATSDLGSIGNEVTVSAGQDSTSNGITANQLTRIESIVGAAEVVPQKTDQVRISSRNGQEALVSVTALTEASSLYEVSVGEAPDRLQSGALLTNSTANQLDLEVGDPVEYEGRQYRIVGLIEPEQEGLFGGRGELVLPISALSEHEYYDSVTILAADGESATRIVTDLDAEFNSEDEQVLSISSSTEIQQQIGSFLDTLSLILLGIGSISLVVASVAILNVMLMSIIERRGEIGVLRAVGVRRGEVLRMVLAEAAFLGVLGGLVGGLISLGVGLVVFELVTSNPLDVFAWESSRYVAYGFGFAVAAALLSGVYPAWKAANDAPVESLRA